MHEEITLLNTAKSASPTSYTETATPNYKLVKGSLLNAPSVSEVNMCNLLAGINANKTAQCSDSIKLAILIMDGFVGDENLNAMEKFSSIISEIINLAPNDNLSSSYFMAVTPVLKHHLYSIYDNGHISFIAKSLSMAVGKCLAKKLYNSLCHHATIKFANLTNPDLLLAKFDKTGFRDDSHLSVIHTYNNKESLEIITALYGLNVNELSNSPDTKCISRIIDYIIPSNGDITIYGESWCEIQKALDKSEIENIFLSYAIHHSLMYIYKLVTKSVYSV